MYGKPVFPMKPEHKTFVFFVDPDYPRQPALWGKVKCRKLDKWLMYDPSTGGTHVFDARNGELKDRNSRVFKLALVGHPNDFNGLTRTEQFAKALALMVAEKAKQPPMGCMAPTFPAITSYGEAQPYDPKYGDLACFVNTKAPQDMHHGHIIRVRGRRKDKWWGEQINGTSSISFDPNTGLAKPFGNQFLLAWIIRPDELDGVDAWDYNTLFAKVGPLIKDAYGKLIEQSLITNPL